MSSKPDFEALFRSCPYPFLLMDTSLTVIDANDAWRRASGAQARDVVGRHVLAAFPPDPDHPDSAEAAALQASIEQVIRTRRVHALPLLRYVAAPEPRYWSVLHTPVFDACGAVISVAQNMVEVTEVPEGGRRRADEEFMRFHRSLMDEAVIRVLTDETSHLRELFQQAPGCAAVLRGRDYVVDMVNDAYSAVVGHRLLLGKPLFEALPDLAGQGFEELLAGVFETGKPYVGRNARMSLACGRDGASGDVYMDFVYQPIFDKSGAVSAVFMQGHEVTEALLAQQAQQAEEDRLRDGLDTARMAVWDWELDSGSIVLSANAPQVLGGHWNEIEAAMGCVPAEDLPLVRAAIAEALATRSRYSVIHRFVRPDNGDLLWLHSRGRVLCDEAGQARSVPGAMVDVTERIRAESELERVNRALAERVRELAEAERRQAFQLEVTDHLRRIGDPDKVYQEVCQMLCRFLGVTRVLCGDFDPRRNLFSLYANYSESGLPPLDASYAAHGFGINYFATLAAGQTWVNEDVAIDPRTAGSETSAAFDALGVRAVLAVPLNLRGPNLPCLFVHHNAPRRWSAEEVNLVEDISGRMWNAVERVRAEQALRQADLRKDEFLAMLAHELRNPLAPISAAADLLRVGSLDYDSIRRTSQVIARQVGHMTGLVNDLLDVSRVTRGLVVLERKVLDIRRVVADAAEQVGPLIEARGHVLHVTEAEQPVMVEGDHKRLVQVLANLLANAAKYTPAGGSIGLGLEVEGSRVLLRVSDNGIGIASDVLPHVFDLFAQAERTPDRSQGGLGLGLALVKSLAELHGGAVDARSDGPGMGCEFTVTLPRLDVAAEPPSRPERRPDVLPLSRTLRLMVVDDNVDAASMLKLLLEGSGHDVVVEHDALAALQHAEHERFDAFLLDIGLPRMEGRELARRLRRSDANCDAVLVAVTGYGQQCDRNSALESGFDHYFVKPVDAEKLLEVLEATNAHDVWV